jgi:high-affinity iron transporter
VVVTIEGILALVTRVASPDSVDARVRGLMTQLTTTWQVSLEEIPATPPSMARGKELYAQECASCHGALGRGDGVVAPTLTPPPADLSAHVELAGTSPLDFYRRISIGVAGTAMPSYESRLTTADRWALALYAATLRLPVAAGSVPVELRRFDATARLSDSAIAEAVAPGRGPDDRTVAAQIAAVRSAGALEGSGRDFAPLFDDVRSKLTAAVDQAEAGQVEQASATAFDAYMAFEGVEPTLRAKDGGLAGRLEAQFASLHLADRRRLIAEAIGHFCLRHLRAPARVTQQAKQQAVV